MAASYQDLLDEEKAEMKRNQMKERSTKSFNFGAYHSLETVGYKHKHVLLHQGLSDPNISLISLTDLQLDGLSGGSVPKPDHQGGDR